MRGLHKTQKCSCSAGTAQSNLKVKRQLTISFWTGSTIEFGENRVLNEAERWEDARRAGVPRKTT